MGRRGWREGREEDYPRGKAEEKAGSEGQKAHARARSYAVERHP